MASPPVSPNVQNFGHYTDVGKRSKHLKEEYTRKYNIVGTYHDQVAISVFEELVFPTAVSRSTHTSA